MESTVVRTRAALPLNPIPPLPVFGGNVSQHDTNLPGLTAKQLVWTLDLGLSANSVEHKWAPQKPNCNVTT